MPAERPIDEPHGGTCPKTGRLISFRGVALTPIDKKIYVLGGVYQLSIINLGNATDELRSEAIVIILQLLS